jgi:TonB-dependent SusC/RagA subfamily outer membrane receptor
VLKDASSAAVYGVQAANGVVLITTKRGRQGKPTVRYDSYVGVQHTPPLWEMNDARTFAQLQQEANDAFNTQSRLTPADGNYLVLHPDLQGNSPLLSRNTDWIGDALNQNAPITNQNVSVSGATNQVSYFVSGGYFGQNATADRWDLGRLSFRANSDFNVTSAVRIGETFTVSYQRVRRGMNGGGDGFLLRNAATMPPFFRIRDSEGQVENKTATVSTAT